MKNVVRVRSYHEPSRLSKRIAGIPVWGLILAVAGIASAAIVSPMLVGGPQTVGGVILTFGATGVDPATDGDIEPNIALATIDGWSVSAAAQGGFAATIHIRLSIIVNSAALKCSEVATTGLITVRQDSTAPASTLMTPKTAAGAACTTAGEENSVAYWYDTTMTKIAPYTGSWFWSHSWGAFPAGAATFNLQANT